MGGGVPDCIEGKIDIVVALGPGCILLHADGIYVEGVGVAVIVEGVDHETRLIIFLDVLASVHMRPDLGRLSVEAKEDDIEILGCIVDERLRSLRCGPAVCWAALDKSSDSCHLTREIGGRLHSGKVLEGRGTFNAGD